MPMAIIGGRPRNTNIPVFPTGARRNFKKISKKRQTVHSLIQFRDFRGSRIIRMVEVPVTLRRQNSDFDSQVADDRAATVQPRVLRKQLAIAGGPQHAPYGHRWFRPSGQAVWLISSASGRWFPARCAGRCRPATPGRPQRLSNRRPRRPCSAPGWHGGGWGCGRRIHRAARDR